MPNHLAADVAPTELRVIGGHLRGRKFAYTGDRRTRPMKERLREAVFNLLGPSVKGSHAVDMFAGSGALGIEALSRGAASATLIERHFPTARAIEDNLKSLGVAEASEVIAADTFHWARRATLPTEQPWLVFCSPPYLYYVSRREEIVEMIKHLVAAAPDRSMFVVESDRRFDPGELPHADAWRRRSYPPAEIALYRKES